MRELKAILDARTQRTQNSSAEFPEANTSTNAFAAF